MRRIAATACVGALALLSGLSSADEPKEGPSETRLWDVRALADGVTRFTPDRGPWFSMPDTVNDEGNPLFGGVAPDRVDLARIDELLAEAKAAVSDSEDVAVTSLGGTVLQVRGPRAAQDAVAKAIAAIARDAMPVLTFDVVAFRGTVLPNAREGGLQAAVSHGDLTLLAAGRTSGFRGQEVVGRVGGAQAYVQDYDVEVAEKSATSDPIVGVLFDGLAFSALATFASAERVRYRVVGWWARPLGFSPEQTSGGDRFEVPAIEGRTIFAEIDAKPGEWTLLPSTGSVVFAARVGFRSLDGLPAEGALTLPVVTGPPKGTLVRRRFDVRDLGTTVGPVMGRSLGLMPSNFTPPAEPETEATLSFPMGRELSRWLRGACDPAYWSEEGSSLTSERTALSVVADAARVEGLEKTLAALRERFLRPIRLRATALSLPLSSFPEYLTGTDDGAGPLLDAEALLKRPGAQVVERAALRLLPGQRSAAVGGRERAYVSDYDVEIAQESAIGNPITRQLFEGVSLDVIGSPVPGSAAVACEVRLNRIWPRETRKFPTRHGTIECPSVGHLKVYGSTIVPFGGTTLLGCDVVGTDATLVLLTANVD